MATKITRDVLEAYLNCKTKAHLKLAGQRGMKSDYEGLLAATKQEVRQAAISHILAQHPEGDVARDIPLTAVALGAGPSFILDAVLEDELLALNFDGLKKVDGSSKLGDFHYIPALFIESTKVRKEHRALLEVYGLLLSRVQGRAPGYGIIYGGPDIRSMRLRLGVDGRKAERVLEETRRLRAPESPPKLVLNDHCPICEFRGPCHDRAIQEDNLSLLRGMGEREIARYNMKGIFTVTQLSYTFRTRRRGKRVKNAREPHHFPLQALALREKKVFVHGSPVLPTSKTQIYLDFEGSPEAQSYYLIGLVVVEAGVETRLCFWADEESEQVQIFTLLLDHLRRYPDYRLFHFGSFEVNALRRMKRQVPEEYREELDGAMSRSVNVLSIVSPYIYFPTYSNSLKDIGRYLGFAWSEPSASGIQSLVWREAWRKTRDGSIKGRLTQYNLEDCLALKRVVEFIGHVISARASEPGGIQASTSAVYTDDLPKADTGHKCVFGKKDFALEELAYINRCAYFDYQRDKVFVRTHKPLRAASRIEQKSRELACRPNKYIELVLSKCPSCRSKKLTRGRMIRRQVVDLKFFRSGVKRSVLNYASWHYSCSRCGSDVIPVELPDATTKYGHGLISWCIYQNVACGQNMLQITRSLRDLFDLSVPQSQVYRFRTAVAEYYRARYKQILTDILNSHVINIDETEAKLRGTEKGYVWVVTSIDAVYYFFRDSREGTFLKDMLKGFNGVLVSDFYTAYDSLDCAHQRCLIHLIRDLNEDLLKNPFNEEFKALARQFSALLRNVIETVDRWGLKKWHLGKHKAEVRRFFDQTGTKEYQSEVAQKYQKRFQKYQDKLFTFLDHDGVPWNNNNAEHAIHCFARYRQSADGKFTEKSLQDYLVILSVFQTCEYRRIKFLKYLLSEKDRGAKFRSGRRKIRVPPKEHP